MATLGRKLGSGNNATPHVKMIKDGTMTDIGAAKKLVLIKLDYLKIKNLLSKDRGFRIEDRDGTLAFVLEEAEMDSKGMKLLKTTQETTLSWATDSAGVLKNQNKFKDQWLYFGPHKGLIDLTVKMIEVDKDVVEGLKKGKSILNFTAGLSAKLVPVAGSIITAGASFIGALLDFIVGKADDDYELAFFGSLDNANSADKNFIPLKEGKYKIVRDDKGTGDYGVEVGLSVHPYTPPEKPAQDVVVVVLDSIDLSNVNDELEDDTLVFESTLGFEKAAFNTSLKMKIKDNHAWIDNVLGLKNKVLYVGPLNIGIPFHVSLAGVKDRDELEVLEGVVDKTGSFIQEVDPGAASAVEGVTKAVQSISSLIVEFLPKKVSIGTLGKIITENGSVFSAGYSFSGALNDWKEISPIVLESQKGGRAVLNLKIKAL